MGFTVDFSQFEKLIKDMKATEQDFNQFLYNFLLRMANEVIRETKPKTPYDTGALRNAWTLGNISGSGENISVEILNPMEYATEIEYGHRIIKGSGAEKVEVGWYQGHFMMTTSIENVQRKMPAAYDIAFKKFCKEHGIGDK